MTPNPRTPDRRALLTAALAAAARGWHVFPLRPNDKRPAFPDHGADHCTGADPRCRNGHVGWESRATTDPDRIRRAWTMAPFNIGVATGPSGLVVIDLDTPKPNQPPPPQPWALPSVHDGADVLTVLCEQAGEPFPLDTHTVTTGRGGMHLYFTHPADTPPLRNTCGHLGWLIDTRSHGGYVVGAGSIVNHRPYTITNEADPAPLPGWLAARLVPPPLPPQRPVTIPVADARRRAYLRRAIDAEIARVTDSPEDGHNNALYQASVALGQLVAGGCLVASDVTAWLADAAARVGQPPGEAHRTIRSGLRAGGKRPRRVAA